MQYETSKDLGRILPPAFSVKMSPPRPAGLSAAAETTLPDTLREFAETAKQFGIKHHGFRSNYEVKAGARLHLQGDCITGRR